MDHGQGPWPKSRVLPKGSLLTANTKYRELLKSTSLLFTVIHGNRGADSGHLPNITLGTVRQLAPSPLSIGLLIPRASAAEPQVGR